MFIGIPLSLTKLGGGTRGPRIKVVPAHPSIPEDAEVDDPVATATVVGTTGTPAWSLEDDASGLFKIHETTGVISVDDTLTAGSVQIEIAVTDVTPSVANKVVTIEVADVTAPSVIARFPEDNATDVEVDTHIELAFDENIFAGEALEVRIYNIDSEPVLLQTFTAADLGVNSQIIGHTYSAQPTVPFESLTNIAVQYDMGSFEDAAGNPVAGVDDFETWNFTTEELDVTAPVLTFPDIVALTSTTAALTVDSTEGNGRMFVIVTTVFTETTAEQIKNGLDGNNNPAVYANDFNVESVGTQYDTATGLEPETEYFAYWVHEDDAENDSNIVTDSDTTPAAAVDSLLMLDSGGVSLLHLGMI